MDDGPLKDFWVEHKGVEIDSNTKDRWAEEAITFAQNSGYGYVLSGDTMVLAVKVEEDKVIEIYDLIIKRRATVYT